MPKLDHRVLCRVILGGLLLTAGPIACSSEPEPLPPPPSRKYLITYQALAVGDAQFDQIRYDNGLGNLQDVLPPIPKTWTTQIQMDQCDTIELTVQGGATTGTLRITVSGEDNVGNRVDVSEEQVGTGTAMTYTLSIPQQQLREPDDPPC